MLDCSKQLLEFAVRRHWSRFPADSVDAVAAKFGMTESQLQSALPYIENLSYETIKAHGLRRLAAIGSTDEALVGFSYPDADEGKKEACLCRNICLSCPLRGVEGRTKMTHEPSKAPPSVEAPSIVPDAAGFDMPRAVQAPGLAFDADAYREFLAESELSESQQQEFLRALWDILVGFVDLGFGLHPINHVSQNTNKLARESHEALSSNDISSKNEEEMADRFTRSAARMDS